MTNPRNFLLSSDYPMDKVVYMTSGSFTASVTLSGNYDIPHGLSFAPLPVLSWSMYSDFSISYEIASSGTVGWESYGLSFQPISDLTKISIQYYNNTGSAKTIYYRIFCFMPSNVNVDVAYTQSTSNNFVIKTDYNYNKLFASGYIDNPMSAGVDFSISHNIGYIPRVYCWDDLGTPSSPLITISGLSTEYSFDNGEINGIQVTTDKIIAKAGTGFYQANRVHYRIYCDE